MGHNVIGIDNMIGGYKDNIPKNITFHKIDCCDLPEIQKIMKNIMLFIIVLQLRRDYQYFPYEITKIITWPQYQFFSSN